MGGVWSSPCRREKTRNNQAGDDVFLTLNAATRAPSSIKRRYKGRHPLGKTVNMITVQPGVTLCAAVSLSGRTRCLCLLAWEREELRCWCAEQTEAASLLLIPPFTTPTRKKYYFWFHPLFNIVQKCNNCNTMLLRIYPLPTNIMIAVFDLI